MYSYSFQGHCLCCLNLQTVPCEFLSLSVLTLCFVCNCLNVSTAVCGTVFGNIECVDIPGCVLPPLFESKFLGQNRGIQGHQNSCYMDATLFSMFAFSMVFDSILHRPRRPNCDSHYYDKVQKALREGIVNPLRK